MNKKVEIRNNADLQAFLQDPIGIITQKTFGHRHTAATGDQGGMKQEAESSVETSRSVPSFLK